jgi:predicted phage terminase large subunit-like protein
MQVSGDMSSHLMDPFLTPGTLAMHLWPSGTDMWVPSKHLLYASSRIASAVLREGSRLIISMPPQHGKQCADSTWVPTTNGWRLHGDLSIGDHVFGIDGKPTMVIGVSAPSMATMIVEFMNGTKVQCHELHEWTVYDRARAAWHTVETRAMAKRKLLSVGAKTRCTLQVGVPDALQYTSHSLPLHPYVLGAWLGDGSVGKACLTGGDKRGKTAVLENVAAHYAPSAKWTHKDTGVDTWSYQDLKEDLRACGVLNDKHIPISYKESSIAQRLELMAGLIDTDGSVDGPTGRVRYVGINETLVRDVAEVARGLGWNVGVTSQEPCVSSSGIVGRHTVWTAAFNPTVEIPTKVAKKVGGRVLESRRMLGIKAVYTADVPETGRCIQVDRADGLYLVTKELIPTHNSNLVTRAGVPWFLEKFPGRSMMLVTYNQDFAENWGGKVKDVIQGRPDLFTTRIREDRSRVDRFETTSGSVCNFLGINGGQTGKDASLIVIDDYIKGIREAMSKAHRDEVWNNYVANIESRIQNNTTVIIVATRWWSDDLIGRLLKSDPEGWEYVCLPAFAKKGDVLGRAEGDVLFPEKQSRALLEKKRKTANVSGVIFDALYQQEPIDDQSEFTNGSWLQVVSGVMPGDGFTLCRAWDMAATQGGGDYSTGTKMGRKGLARPAYIFNVMRKQFSPLKVEKLIRATAVADGIECVVLLEQEPGSQGAALIEHYKRNVLPEFTVIGVPAGNKSKLLKAQPFIAACEAGSVYMVDNSGGATEPEWISLFRAEFGDFPPSSDGNDDQVDTASIGFNHLFQHDIVSPSWGTEDAMHNGTLVLRMGASPESDALIAQLEHVYGDGGDGSKLITGAVW